MTDLKACPFCGNAPKRDLHANPNVWCDNDQCAIVGTVFSGGPSHWNTRAQASAPEGGEAVAWLDPKTGDAITSQRKNDWETYFGVGAIKKASAYTIPLYTSSNAKAGEVVLSHASDEEIRAWADRHDLALSITAAREAFEDAATAHLLDNSTQRGEVANG